MSTSAFGVDHGSPISKGKLGLVDSVGLTDRGRKVLVGGGVGAVGAVQTGRYVKQRKAISKGKLADALTGGAVGGAAGAGAVVAASPQLRKKAADASLVGANKAGKATRKILGVLR